MRTQTIKTKDEQRISFDHYQNGHDKAVIIAHGFFNSKDALLLRELGDELGDKYDLVIMDFRGHGKSGGLFHWTSKEYLDLEAVLEYVRKTYEKVGVIGFSLGAATSLIEASRGDLITSLVAVSAPTEFAKIEYRFWELSFENDIVYSLFSEGRIGKGVRPGPFWQKKHKPLDLVGKITCPVLFIHGEDDWLIKPWHSEELFKKTNSKKQLAMIKNGPHAEYSIRKNKTETLKIIEKWFQETL